ncbi:LOW QUALITY PROTEIN: hypothetical protein U9M48_026671 [Paspalum notatum var. saurae]|uniref:Uncharacterized protein n=1 Tax=Paspalum notatum var. saurae TaxID=547442 RepID=A0AAQ3TT07_PASNO
MAKQRDGASMLDIIALGESCTAAAAHDTNQASVWARGTEAREQETVGTRRPSQSANSPNSTPREASPLDRSPGAAARRLGCFPIFFHGANPSAREAIEPSAGPAAARQRLHGRGLLRRRAPASSPSTPPLRCEAVRGATSRPRTCKIVEAGRLLSGEDKCICSDCYRHICLVF